MTNQTQQLLRRYLEHALIGAIGAGLTLYINDKIQDSKITALQELNTYQVNYLERRLDMIQQEIRDLRQMMGHAK